MNDKNFEKVTPRKLRRLKSNEHQTQPEPQANPKQTKGKPPIEPDTKFILL